jgi:hypothetical protein
MYEAEINALLHLAIEITCRNQILQGDCDEWPELPGYISEHAPPHWFGM